MPCAEELREMGQRDLWCSEVAGMFPGCASPIQPRGRAGNRTRIPCGHLTREHISENSVDTLERRWEMLVKMREQETNCRRFDNTPGTRKHRATELFNERHVCRHPSAQDFFRDVDICGPIRLQCAH